MSPALADPPSLAVRSTPLPHTPEELRSEPNYPLWVRWGQGDAAARDQLVVNFAPLVKYVLGRLVFVLPPSMDSDDLLSAGTIGLLQAVDRYDPNIGVKFETYALQRIRGAMLDALRASSPISRGAQVRARRLEEITGELAHQLGRAPTHEELAEALGESTEAFGRRLQEASFTVISLDAPRGDGGDEHDGGSLEEMLADPHGAGTLEQVEGHEEVEALTTCLQTLGEREQLVLSLYYEEELTLKEIGQVLEVSESRVSQIHSATILKLRAAMRRQGAFDCVAA